MDIYDTIVIFVKDRANMKKELRDLDRHKKSRSTIDRYRITCHSFEDEYKIKNLFDI
jgi:hypothetical protein